MTTEEKEEHDNKLMQKYRELFKEVSHPPHLISETMRNMERRLNPVENTAKDPRRRRNRNHAPRKMLRCIINLRLRGSEEGAVLTHVIN